MRYRSYCEPATAMVPVPMPFGPGRVVRPREGPPVSARRDAILETKDLTKEFAGFVAVNGVSLRVARGTIHALIGPNGAGKTTCFNLLTKFLRPTRGRIMYKGREITGMAPADVA